MWVQSAGPDEDETPTEQLTEEVLEQHHSSLLRGAKRAMLAGEASWRFLVSALKWGPQLTFGASSQYGKCVGDVSQPLDLKELKWS